MTVRAYPTYRDSGVAWIDAVPAHWQVKRISWLFRTIGSGTTPPTDHDGYYDGEMPWVTTGELREAGISSTTKMLTVKALQDLSALSVYPVGTLLIAMYGATIGRLGWLEVPAAVNQACCAFAEPVSTNSRFVYYSLTAALEALLLMSSGGGQPNVNQEKLRAFRVPAPSLFEQSAIVAFLDRETGKIDVLVTEQERLIALLKEKRQAVISHAVTKGLNPNAPMKDSGILWLGEVPAHWEVRSISSLTTKITNGYVGPTRDILVVDGIRYLQSLHVKQNQISFHTPFYVSPKWSAQHNKSVLSVGDVLVVQTGDVGQTAMVNDEFAGCNCHALIILAPKLRLLTGQWLSWVLNSSLGQQTLASIQTGALHPHLNCGDVKDIRIPLPPVSEQKKLTDRIERDSEGLVQLETEATRAITLLRERRAALISAAVTGKIDVRDTVIQSSSQAA